MSIKIKTCTGCWHPYTLEQLGKLELVSVDEQDGAETRRCRCKKPLIVDVRHFAKLDLRTPTQKLMDARDVAIAQARRERLQKYRPTLLALVGTVLLVVVAFVLWAN